MLTPLSNDLTETCVCSSICVAFQVFFHYQALELECSFCSTILNITISSAGNECSVRFCNLTAHTPDVVNEQSGEVSDFKVYLQTHA